MLKSLYTGGVLRSLKSRAGRRVRWKIHKLLENVISMTTDNTFSVACA
jgi:hypothetical protein